MFFISSLIAFILIFPLGIFVFSQGTKKSINIVYALFLLSLAFGIFGDFFYFTKLPSYFSILTLLQTSYIGAVFAPCLLIHFIFLFTKTKLYKATTFFLYSISFLLLSINISYPVLFFKKYHLDLTGKLFLITGIAADLFYAYIMVAVVLSFSLVLYRLFYSPEHEKLKMKYYLLAAGSMILAALVYSAAMTLNISNVRIDNLFLVGYAAVIAYTITKHDLMDIRVVITKTTASLIAISVALTTFFSVFFLTENKTTLFFLSALTLVFWSLKFQDFRLFLQTTLEKKFLKNRYNYASVIQRFVDGFGKCSEIDDVAQVLKSTFNDEMEIADVRVYFPEFYEMTFRTSGTFVELVNDTDQTTHAPLTTDTNWIQTLSDQKTVLISSELTELADLGIAAALPCFEDGNLVCLVLLGKKLSEDGFKPEDVSLFSTIASQIPAVLDRIHRSRASVELDLAQRIQTEILPKAPEIPGLELACYMKPADEVGGDYYDVVVAGEFAWVLLGDVTGHGLGSGLVMFMAQSILTSILQTREQIEPAELNYLANQILYKNLQRLDEQLPMTFVSLCFHEGRSFTVSGCHDNFLIYRAASQSIEMLSLDHFALGIGFSDSFVREDYTQSAYTLAAGDVIFMVTDGITEAFCGGNVKLEQYGEERLKTLFLKHAAGSAEEVKAALIAELDEFTGGIYHDDVTFIVAKAV